MNLLVIALLMADWQTVLLGHLWPPRPPDDPPPPPPPIQHPLTAARQADCVRDTSNGNLFGETAQVRGEAAVPPMPPDLARAAAAARMAQDRQAAERILGPFLGDGLAPGDQLARIQLAYALLRTAPDDPARVGADALALLTPPQAFLGYSDAHYIRAVVAFADRDGAAALQAVESALQINRDYYNAVLLRAVLLMQEADAAFRQTAACEPLLQALTSAVVPVARLGACPLQLAHVRLALDRALPPSKGGSRVEMWRVLDIALAYAARKDKLHETLLAQARESGAACLSALGRYDFGTAME